MIGWTRDASWSLLSFTLLSGCLLVSTLGGKAYPVSLGLTCLILIALGCWLWVGNILILQHQCGIDVDSVLFGHNPISKATPDLSDDTSRMTDDSKAINKGTSLVKNVSSTPSAKISRRNSSAIASLNHPFSDSQSTIVSHISWVVSFPLLVRLAGWDANTLLGSLSIMWAFGLLVIGLVVPFTGYFPAERGTLMNMLRRIFFGGINGRVAFIDVIVSDIFTSFSPVWGDLWVLFSQVFILGSVSKNSPVLVNKLTKDFNLDSRPSILPSAIDSVGVLCVCLPYLIRLRQCISEYNANRDPTIKANHFQNALKYVTSFPVIMLAFSISHFAAKFEPIVHTNPEKAPIIEGYLMIAIFFWAIFSLINTVFGLYWDIVMDWGLMRSFLFDQRDYLNLESSSNINYANSYPSEHQRYLRSVILFRPWTYYVAIILEFLMRFSWILRITTLYSMASLTSHLQQSESLFDLPSMAALNVGLKVAELVRRWGWVFLRVEKERVFSASLVSSGSADTSLVGN